MSVATAAGDAGASAVIAGCAGAGLRAARCTGPDLARGVAACGEEGDCLDTSAFGAGDGGGAGDTAAGTGVVTCGGGGAEGGSSVGGGGETGAAGDGSVSGSGIGTCAACVAGMDATPASGTNSMVTATTAGAVTRSSDFGTTSSSARMAAACSASEAIGAPLCIEPWPGSLRRVRRAARKPGSARKAAAIPRTSPFRAPWPDSPPGQPVAARPRQSWRRGAPGTRCANRISSVVIAVPRLLPPAEKHVRHVADIRTSS